MARRDLSSLMASSGIRSLVLKVAFYRCVCVCVCVCVFVFVFSLVCFAHAVTASRIRVCLKVGGRSFASKAYH